jgi:hypothetical protein
MLSHEPKNYALLGYDGDLLLRGVAFRSIRAEPYGEAFLRRAAACLLHGDMLGLRTVYCETVDALRRREVPTVQVSAQARLTKTPKQYLAARGARREAVYEALLAAGRERWALGERVRVYRAVGGRPALLPPDEEADPRNYDVAHYVRLLRETFAARLERAFTTEDFATLFADPEQPSLFAPPIAAIQPVLVSKLAPPTAP